MDQATRAVPFDDKAGVAGRDLLDFRPSEKDPTEGVLNEEPDVTCLDVGDNPAPVEGEGDRSEHDSEEPAQRNG
jgi:hypothetical protein